MSSVWKRGLKKQGSRTNTETKVLSETDGPYGVRREGSTTSTRKQLNNDNFLEMYPDKELEEKVLYTLDDHSQYLTNNLPADDVAPMMLSYNLLTQKEYDEYKTMRRSGRSTMANMNEYLLECLHKREPGFLKIFCHILWEIEPARYLADTIKQAYKELVLQGGFNAHSRDRLSKISTSDPELRPNTPQGNVTTPCTVCRRLKKRNRQLEKFNSELKDQLIELNKDHRRLQEAKTMVEGQLVILQDQLVQEKKNLEEVVPHLQKAIGLIESSCRAASASSSTGAQQTLNRISDLLKEQSKQEKVSTVLRRRHIRVQHSDSSKRDSMLSMFSDTSSLADEELHHSHSSDNLVMLEKNRLSTENVKSVVSNLHHSVIHSPMTSKNQVHQFSQNVENKASAAVQVTEGVQESNMLLEVPDTKVQVETGEKTCDSKPQHRSESSPDIDTSFMAEHSASRSQLNVMSRARLNSEPSETMKQTRTQSVKHENKVKPYSQSRAPTVHKRVEGEELTKILSKIRKKIDSESDTTEQQPPANTQ